MVGDTAYKMSKFKATLGLVTPKAVPEDGAPLQVQCGDVVPELSLFLPSRAQIWHAPTAFNRFGPLWST